MLLNALPPAAQTLAGFPPPPLRGIDLPGPFFVAFYTLAIMTGIVLAVVVATRLWKSRGGHSDDIFSAMLWAVLIGILGARLYHVVSSPDAYFGPDGDLTRIPQLWQGGLSIIGAVMAGALAVWIFCRRNGIKFGAFADAIVPGVILAQAIGRWGNWFNQELFGRATDLPWGLRIDTDQQHQGLTGSLPAYAAEGGLFHPTFLYESLWNLLGFVALVFLFKRFQFRQGLIAWTYVAYYALGRFWIESMRIDEVNKSTQYPLRDVIGLDWRLNQIIAFVIFVAAAAILVRLFLTRPRTLAEQAEHAEIYTPDSTQRSGEPALEPAGADPEAAGTEAEPPAEQRPPGTGPRSEH
ncbi:prolipoprotein diacylglyceryl transferase [Nesterenkonia sphaerica]|uniref:Phosphatidylglycerol--prolipoprotein diacylglyceryl transferase n=1 Tax=Nesterenkonia sphaerica TaxID=1804988 RepID=A0A5R9AHQ6_9MICC|nr:prolipoprotein diacylglyceryl transferase [Nesterenkonia sphaerica]TLP77437.1 prolipoprotein diacylglyceryl transferase [Nesterenkonia sphaerica]